MRVRVEFRYNAETGEVELLQIDDIGRTTRLQDHDAAHDDIAHAIGRVLDRRPDVHEVAADGRTGPVATPAGPERTPEPEPARPERLQE
ncbi:hypothetical protein [Streptomyces endophyticus]|uniref:FtsH ternary system domain-containing protein n=1 Tax=Streptomyces endophyticus TaxID=714166 RepID=A0ABU6FG40_9ACTN|nr:hypothetical protein [Streptomyces endophyticus]MEB8343010.1 hypothetical protein [Streptomyces endophyticus]